MESAASSRDKDSSSVSSETAGTSKGILFWISRKAEKVKLLNKYILLQQKGSVLLHDFVLYLWTLLSKGIQTKWPSYGGNWVKLVGDGAVTRLHVPWEHASRFTSWCWQHRATAVHLILHDLKLLSLFIIIMVVFKSFGYSQNVIFAQSRAEAFTWGCCYWVAF